VRRFSVVRDDGDLGQSDSREMVQFSWTDIFFKCFLHGDTKC
jgi:hypothetical protein